MDYENRGTAQARLKDTALVRFGDILRESESWISNFVDMSKVKLAVAEAGAFVAKDAKAEIK